MTDLDKLKDEAEKADDKAGKLSGEYEAKRQEALDKLRDRYRDRIEQATADAAATQKAYMDALVLNDLQDRPDGPAVGQTLVAQGGLTQQQVDDAGLGDA